MANTDSDDVAVTETSEAIIRRMIIEPKLKGGKLTVADLEEGHRLGWRWKHEVPRPDWDWLLGIAREAGDDPWKLVEAKEETVDARVKLGREDWYEQQKLFEQEKQLEMYLALLWAKPLGLRPTSACNRAAKQIAGVSSVELENAGYSYSRFFDHTYYWRSGEGSPVRSSETFVVTTHPYNVGDKYREAAAAVCERVGAVVEYPEFPSWWNHPRTTFVVWRAGPDGEGVRRRRRDQEFMASFGREAAE